MSPAVGTAGLAGSVPSEISHSSRNSKLMSHSVRSSSEMSMSPIEVLPTAAYDGLSVFMSVPGIGWRLAPNGLPR